MNQLEITESIKLIIKGQAGSTPRSKAFFEEIRKNVLTILKMMQPDLVEADDLTLNSYYNTAVREYISVFPIDMESSSSLVKKGFRTWLTADRKKTLSTNYIDRYIRLLKKQSRSEKVIEEIRNSSEQILGKLGDPQAQTITYKKGLVVGSVQSGKTGNFNAVINRAIDAGYNLIIILSGIMEDLRGQTQVRLENDVIGENSTGTVGVGKIRRFGSLGDDSVVQVFSITSSKSDFKTSLLEAGFVLNNKNLLVCKKNTGVLKNLLIWLSDYLQEHGGQHDIPFLIVDDEADNASLNNLGHKGRDYATTINGHVRAILKLFSRATYLGYTATPFANVLQDKNKASDIKWKVTFKRNGQSETRYFEQVDNIYPDDFIELLNAPSNYIGAKQIFNTIAESEVPKIPLVESVADCFNAFPIKVIDEPAGVRPASEIEIKDRVKGLRSPRKGDFFPKGLPQSLEDAIACFILAIAVRLNRTPNMLGSRLFNPHNTMLIHVSRYTDWQNRTQDLVKSFVTNLSERISNDFPSGEMSIYAWLERIWNRYYAAIIANIRNYLPAQYADEFLEPVVFATIKQLLPEAIKGVEVKAINSYTKEKLIYTTDASGIGKKFIAIGGNRLSRGFTLEGLTINYFIRSTNYADTLLQMGRWFGYRPGYIDCCKLFTTLDAVDKFNQTTRTVEELETEFKKMHRQGKTPEDFIIRVKKHTGALKITRPAILKNTVEVNWSYQDYLEQTTKFDLDNNRIGKAWNEIRTLFHENSSSMFYADSFYQYKTDLDGIVKILNCANSFHDYEDDIAQIKAFLERCKEVGKLKSWRVAIRSSRDGRQLLKEESGLPSDIGLTTRSGHESGPYRDELISGVFTASGKSANLITTGGDLALLLDEGERRRAEQEFVEEKTGEFIKKGLSQEAASLKASLLTKPERIYCECMSDETGIFLIYPMDLKKVFREDFTDPVLEELRQKRDIDTSIPLIGYAIGFPPIEPDPGGVYLRGDYGIDEEADEETADEYDTETLDEDQGV